MFAIRAALTFTENWKVTMPHVTVGQKDFSPVDLYYKDWGKGPTRRLQPRLAAERADAWEDQMLFLGAHGYRCIAHDRRGHGRSSQPWDGNEMDTYADDLASARRSARPEGRDPSSATPRAAARSPVTSVATARNAWRRPC